MEQGESVMLSVERCREVLEEMAVEYQGDTLGLTSARHAVLTRALTGAQ